MEFLWIIALIIFIVYMIIRDKKVRNSKDYKEALTQNKKPPRKLLVKRWWSWGLIFVLICGFFVSISNDADNHDETSNTTEHRVEKRTTMKKKASTSNNSTKASKPKPVKNTAKAVTLGAGKYKVGRDIKPGRYVIKPVQGSGNLTNSDATINVILGNDVDSDQVSSFTTNLVKNDKINLDGIESTSFTPTPNKYTYKTQISAGIWLVGRDIKPGRYVIRPIKGSGNLMSDGSDDDLNEILGTDSDSGQVSKVTADLTAGEVILTNLELIGLSKK